MRTPGHHPVLGIVPHEPLGNTLQPFQSFWRPGEIIRTQCGPYFADIPRNTFAVSAVTFADLLVQDFVEKCQRNRIDFLNPSVFLNPGMGFSSQVTLRELIQPIQRFLGPGHLHTIRQSCKGSGILSLSIGCLEFCLINRKQPLSPRVTNATFDDIPFMVSITTGAFQGDLFRGLTSMGFCHFLFQHAKTFRIVRIHPPSLHLIADGRHGLHGAGRKNLLHRFGDNAGCDHAVSPLQRITKNR